MWKARRRTKLFAQPLLPDWLHIVEACCPYYLRLSAADRRELQGHIQIFLAEKQFEGCGGLALTDEIRLTIAANACLLLLHRQTDYFPRLRSVLVYPENYFAQVTRQVGHGVLAEETQSRAGEAWPQGAVIVSWAEVCRDLAANGKTSVIIHEFAHQLDFEDGYADGAPVLEPATSPDGKTRRSRREQHAAWTRVMKSGYERLHAQIVGQTHGLPQVLRPYGATNPAEFFAVATEAFFGSPAELRTHHADLYAELKWYFNQDPAAWPAINVVDH